MVREWGGAAAKLPRASFAFLSREGLVTLISPPPPERGVISADSPCLMRGVERVGAGGHSPPQIPTPLPPPPRPTSRPAPRIFLPDSHPRAPPPRPRPGRAGQIGEPRWSHPGRDSRRDAPGPKAGGGGGAQRWGRGNTLPTLPSSVLPPFLPSSSTFSTFPNVSHDTEGTPLARPLWRSLPGQARTLISQN